MTNDDEPAPPLEWPTVWMDLQSGSLDKLAVFLRETDGDIGEVIARYLATLIDGTIRQTGYRLKLEKHPLQLTKRPGREQQIFKARDVLRMATFMVEAGAFERGCYQSALVATAQHFEVSQATVVRSWRRWKDVPAFKSRAIALRRYRVARSVK